MNGIPLFHKNICKITFLTAENCIPKSADNIIKELHTVNSMYKSIGFNIEVYHGEN